MVKGSKKVYFVFYIMTLMRFIFFSDNHIFSSCRERVLVYSRKIISIVNSLIAGMKASRKIHLKR